MPRIRPRKAMGFDKDIAALLRCRNAIAVDTELAGPIASETLSLIDQVVKNLVRLRDGKERKSGELPILEEESA